MRVYKEGDRAILPAKRLRTAARMQHCGALPVRFRRPRILIVGCGDVGLRAAHALPAVLPLRALTSSPARLGLLRERGITALTGDLDDPSSVRRLAGLATHVLHLAPPQSSGAWDQRTRALIQVLRRGRRPVRALVYGSTSAVYGDCGGEIAIETRAPQAYSPRAARRLDAEEALRLTLRRAVKRVCVLRIPGIYAPDRADGTPRERLLRGMPVLRAQDDVYTNHIHADDLARACLAALWRGRPQRIYNANDDSVLKMGDYYDLAADLYGLSRPRRVSRDEAQTLLSPMTLSFMQDSRRMDNSRLRRELRVRLRYPTVASGLL